MKERKMKHNLLKLSIMIIVISAITAFSFAIYKSKLSGNMQATGAFVVLDVQKLQQSKEKIDEENTETILEFSVNNYITENEQTKLNQTLVEYYIKVAGLDQFSSILSYRCFYIDSENNEIELYQETSGNFEGYYKANKNMGVMENESDKYKIVVNLTEENLAEKNVTISVDVGYKQYIATDITDIPIPNKPKLADGMIPAVWNEGIKAWVTISKDNSGWYDYDNKKWANIITVSEENKYKYIGVPEGTIIEANDITTMYVWVPRFVYKINSNYYHKKVTQAQMKAVTDQMVDIHFSKPQEQGGDNWDTNIVVNNDTTSDAANDKWTTCPAFTFGDIELDGLWAMKFEAANSGSATSIDNIYSKPTKVSINSVSMNQMYNGARNMETKTIYGMQTASSLQADGTFAIDSNGYDTHMMKNSEWSAIALFTQSKYGVGNQKVKGNQIFNAGGSQNTVETFTTNVSMSSTGTAYGIYDLAGNKWEYVAAYFGDGTVAMSKASNLYNALPRYKDVYHTSTTSYNSQTSVYNMFENFKCATIWETSATGVNSYDTWFEGRSNIGYGTSNLFLTRGAAGSGNASNSASTEIYAFGYGDGSGTSTRAFRVVLAVDDNL